MATDKTDFEVWLKSKWDGDALKAAEADFKRTQRSAKDTEQSFDQLGYSAKNLKGMLLELVAFAEVVAQFKEGFEQVAALEQAMNQLERAAKRNGDNFDEVKGQIVGMANALKKAAGVDDDAAIKKMSELYNATGDVANAMNLVALATDVAIGAGIDFEQANDLVTKAAMGQTRGLKELNISLEESGDKTANANKALELIRKNYGGAAQDAKGLTVEINRLSEGWEDMRNTVVEKLTPALGIAIKSVQVFFTVLDALWGAATDGLVRIFTGLQRVASATGQVMAGDFAGAKATFKAGIAEIAGIGAEAEKRARETAKRVADIWAGAGEKVAINAGKPKAIVTGGGGGTGGGGTFQQDPAITEENFRQEQLRKLREKMEDERLKSEADFQRNVVRLRVMGQKNDERIEKEITKTREEEMHARSQMILQEVRLKQAAAEHEKAMQMEVANAGLALMGQVFGESKGLAIAQAIINTYEGATKALGQGGIYGPVLAAIVIAAGMAQVAKIGSTNPSTEGRGFDDPGNDAAARIGGRRWAMDMIGEFTGGASEISRGWASGMMGTSTTTNDNRRTYNVHLHGAGLIDPTNVQMAKQFKRTLDVLDTQIEGQRTVARRRS